MTVDRDDSRQNCAWGRQNEQIICKMITLIRCKWKLYWQNTGIFSSICTYSTWCPGLLSKISRVFINLMSRVSPAHWSTLWFPSYLGGTINYFCKKWIQFYFNIRVTMVSYEYLCIHWKIQELNFHLVIWSFYHTSRSNLESLINTAL